jgi:hypothetical protein
MFIPLPRIISVLKRFWVEAHTALSYFVSPHPMATTWKMHRKLCNPSWYHDFSPVGVETRLFPGSEYQLSQEDKQEILFELLKRAKDEFMCSHQRLPSLVDLFCADAFYSIYALKTNLVAHSVGIDLEQQAGEGSIRMGVLQQAATIRALLGLEGRLDLISGDVMAYEGEYDVCLCAGGLYHISDPAALIARITLQTRALLLIQTVIPSHISESEPFFVAPAPHWTWGSRFNRNWLEKILAENGWTILVEDTRPMRANTHNWDQLSLSVLCTKRDGKPVATQF